MIILRILSGLIGVISGLSSFVVAYLVYFSKTADPSTGYLVDGFGRELSMTPTIIRFIFDADSLWVGPIWSVIDFIAMAILMMLAIFCLSWSFKSE